jgi:hypothetical protein
MHDGIRIYRDTLPPTTSATGRPYWLLRSAFDPLLAVAVYPAALYVWGASFKHDDFVLLCIALLLMFPADIPLRRFSVEVASRILLVWLKVQASLVFFWTAKALLLDSEPQANANVFATWSKME